MEDLSLLPSLSNLIKDKNNDDSDDVDDDNGKMVI